MPPEAIKVLTAVPLTSWTPPCSVVAIATPPPPTAVKPPLVATLLAMTPPPNTWKPPGAIRTSPLETWPAVTFTVVFMTAICSSCYFVLFLHAVCFHWKFYHLSGFIRNGRSDARATLLGGNGVWTSANLIQNTRGGVHASPPGARRSLPYLERRRPAFGWRLACSTSSAM